MTDYRDKLTLDEMGENDLAMTEDAAEKSVKKHFYTKSEAIKYQAACVKQAIESTGVRILPGMGPKQAGAQLKWHNVQIETRRKYKGDDVWRCGVYIYKKGELIAFVSQAFYSKDSRTENGVIIGNTMPYYVRTNVKVK